MVKNKSSNNIYIVDKVLNKRINNGKVEYTSNGKDSKSKFASFSWTCLCLIKIIIILN